MGGIYGSVLLAWAEQTRSLEVFDMTARVNGGWETVADSEVRVRGVFQNTAGDRIKDGNGNLVSGGGMELWTATGGLEGKFLRHSGILYRLNGQSDWTREGGFCRYSLEKVVGNDGAESDDASWNLGGGSFR